MHDVAETSCEISDDMGSRHDLQHRQPMPNQRFLLAVRLNPVVPTGRKKERNTTRHVRVDLRIDRPEVHLEQRPGRTGSRPCLKWVVGSARERAGECFHGQDRDGQHPRGPGKRTQLVYLEPVAEGEGAAGQHPVGGDVVGQSAGLVSEDRHQGERSRAIISTLEKEIGAALMAPTPLPEALSVSEQVLKRSSSGIQLKSPEWSG
jgi:hypothetical protein